MSDLLNRYRNNKCNEDDFVSVLEMLSSSDENGELDKDMQQHWIKTNNEGNIPDLTNTLYKIHYFINMKEKKQVKKLSLVKYFTRIAAILIIPISIAFGYFLVDNYSSGELVRTISSPLASRTSFDLPDGSKVWLNAGSTITFPDHFSKNSRQVKLSGQAFFDIRKDKVPFFVVTEKFTVKVLGTAFDVLAYQGENALVTLVRGKVSIDIPTGDKKVLNPGQQALIDHERGIIQKRDVDPSQFVSWKDNLLVFADEPLEQFVLKLERWYNLDISIEDESIKKIHVTGTFNYEGISEILELMEITDSIKYTYNKDKRTIILKHK